MESSLCSEPGHADVNDFFGDIVFRPAPAIDALRRQCELHLRDSRFTSSDEIEVAHNLAHLVATPTKIILAALYCPHIPLHLLLAFLAGLGHEI